MRKRDKKIERKRETERKRVSERKRERKREKFKSGSTELSLDTIDSRLVAPVKLSSLLEGNQILYAHCSI